MEKEIRGWYKTILLSAHCMCEQGYDPLNLISIAKYIEQTSGIKANPVCDEIMDVIGFHLWHDKQLRKENKDA